MVALYLDDPLLEGAATTAAALQLSSQGLKLFFVEGKPGNDRDVLPPPPLGLPADPDDAIARRSCRLLPADAPLDRSAAGGADPAQKGGVDKSAVGRLPAHGGHPHDLENLDGNSFSCSGQELKGEGAIVPCTARAMSAILARFEEENPMTSETAILPSRPLPPLQGKLLRFQHIEEVD